MYDLTPIAKRFLVVTQRHIVQKFILKEEKSNCIKFNLHFSISTDVNNYWSTLVHPITIPDYSRLYCTWKTLLISKAVNLKF